MPLATLAEIVRHQAARQPERIALIFENRDTSYAALDCRASQVANGLIAAGLRPASRPTRTMTAFSRSGSALPRRMPCWCRLTGGWRGQR